MKVCCSCGWIVTRPQFRSGTARCECGGIAVSFRAAMRALGAETSRKLIEATPERRARALSARRT